MAFQIDISVDNKKLYHIDGRNLTERGLDYAGVCAYELDVKGDKFTLFHERRDGLLRLSSKVLARLCRECACGKIDRKRIECR